MPEHGPHAAPLVPQAVVDVPSWQAPLASQHSVGHEAGVHEGTHAPAAQVSPVPQGTQEVPPVPQVVVDEVWHCPSLPQQPLAQVGAVHATDASPSPLATSFGASVVPSTCAPLATWSADASAPPSASSPS